MHERDEEEIIPDNEAIEKLETVTFHLNELCQRLSKDRDSWAMTGGDLAQAVEELQKHIKGFVDVEEKFKQQLAKFIREESKQAAATVAESLKQEINPVADRFVQIVRNTEMILRQYEWVVDEANSKWKAAITPLLAAMLGAVIGGTLLYYAGGFDNPRVVIQKTVAPVHEVQKKSRARDITPDSEQQ